MKRQTPKRTRKIPAQDRSRQTVEAILEGATRVLAEFGYEHTNTNLIAARAGVGIGSVYQFFANKEAIVGAVIERVYEADRRAIEAVLAKRRHEKFERLVIALLRELLRRFARERKLRRVIQQELPRSARLAPVEVIKTGLRDVFREFLDTHGAYRPSTNLETKLFILVNAIEATLYAAIFEQSFQERILLRELKNLVIACLRPSQ